jgi:hypothetical protein
MVLLLPVAWAPSRIALHLGYCATVRGVAALHPKRTGPPPDRARRERVEGLLRERLGGPRAWTIRQLAVDLAGALRRKQAPARDGRARLALGDLKRKRPPAA